jgi:hypothetical protein
MRVYDDKGCCDLDSHVSVRVDRLYSVQCLARCLCVTQCLTVDCKLLPGNQDCIG